MIIDDFREAYYWLNQNTEPDAKVLAWWDYGYQLAGMSNRTTMVDNNTWNFTHIGLVAKVLTADEQEAHQICSNLGADYVLVTFGGYHGFPTDDYIKFLWFVRIAHDAYPEVTEWGYYKDRKFGLAADELSDKLANSLTFKLMYHRFGEIQLSREYPAGWDYSRRVQVDPDRLNYQLTGFEEAYSSANWIVRIYKVLPQPNRAPAVK